MLGEYISEQPLICEILSNEIKNNKLSHAYLFDVSLYPKSFQFIYSFIKSMMCSKKKLINDGCRECNLCKTIDDNNFPDIILIEPQGTSIKKEQLLSLQKNFNHTSLYDRKKIYIIKYAENLNQSAANSILKFLEEPEGNITAILLTKNIENVLITIKSRCQVLTCLPVKEIDGSIKIKIGHAIFDDQQSLEEFIKNDNSSELIEKIINFINFYEKNGISTLAYTKKYWLDNFNDKKNNIIGYNLMVLYYKDVINLLLNRKIEYFIDYVDLLEKTSLNNTIDKICKKIDIIVSAINYNKYNVNLALNLDNLIIKMEEIR